MKKFAWFRATRGERVDNGASDASVVSKPAISMTLVDSDATVSTLTQAND